MNIIIVEIKFVIKSKKLMLIITQQKDELFGLLYNVQVIIIIVSKSCLVLEH